MEDDRPQQTPKEPLDKGRWQTKNSGDEDYVHAALTMLKTLSFHHADQRHGDCRPQSMPNPTSQLKTSTETAVFNCGIIALVALTLKVAGFGKQNSTGSIPIDPDLSAMPASDHIPFLSSLKWNGYLLASHQLQR